MSKIRHPNINNSQCTGITTAKQHKHTSRPHAYILGILSAVCWTSLANKTESGIELGNSVFDSILN
jgi:hypothetical protein